jgi:hypothetical protein
MDFFLLNKKDIDPKTILHKKLCNMHIALCNMHKYCAIIYCGQHITTS